jgi:hypothetical protein
MQGGELIELHFQGLHAAQSVVVGPAEGFRLAGNFLRQLPEGIVVGDYSRHQWHVRDGHFSRYDVRRPCWITFADAEGALSSRFGPFESLFTADGTMYAADKLFAKFIDETVLWHSFELESYWPSLIITAVSSSDAEA